ncbi:HTH domain-containing protein [Salinirubrum litoreum]|uniref:HTH domain-containing protein n=1 Tax=Salinirubrum litoreum TaxID=1126234 RepID=A0ABD5R6U5_9EURY|nr:HTH domain-containing protein [Salinirubrum litoreum]
MAESSVGSNLPRLVELLHDRLKQSELDILHALAEADGDSLSVDELVEETGYTERTVKKRTETLEEQVHGGTLIRRTDEDEPALHPAFARAVREYEH